MNTTVLLLSIAFGGGDPDVLALDDPELMLDPRLVASMSGLHLRMHPPRPAEVALRFDRPWEGIVSGYVTVLCDPVHESAPLRMYYRGRPTTNRRDGTEEAREVSCLAESADGVHWTRPSLRLHEVDGSFDNNVVLAGPAGVTHNFCPFLDTRPGVPDDERYKAVGGIASTGLWAFLSPDGVLWRPAQDQPIIREGALDSQNVVFYSHQEAAYVCYLRTWRDGVRWISRCTSSDFLRWSSLEDLDFGDAPREHLYTNQIQPYFRARDLLIGTAARFFPGRRGITPENARAIDLHDPRNYAGLDSGVSDAVLITGRQGIHFQRPFLESFVRPGPRLGNWVARANYPALGIVPTGPGEMSMYVQRCYGQQDHHVQRLVMRTDGFVSLSAPYAGGEWTSRPFRFEPSDHEPADRFVGAPHAAAEADDAAAADTEPDDAAVGGTDAREEDASDIDAAMGAETADDADLAIVVDHAAPGGSALRFRRAASFAIPGSAALGERFSLSARVSQVPAGHRRLFSAYDGGPTAPGELVFDFDCDGDLGDGSAIRFHYDGHELNVPGSAIPPWVREDRPRTLSVSFDRGAVEIGFNGHVVGRGRFPVREVSLRLGDLRFGEDYPPTSVDNEPFLGCVDQILVHRPGLDPSQIQSLSTEDGIPAREGDAFFLPVTSEDSTLLVHDHWGAADDLRLPSTPAMARQRLWINASTSAAGGLRFELQDEAGIPIPGFAMADCQEYVGDEVEGFVRWRQGADVSELAGRTLRLRGWMKDADLFSLQFR